MVCEKVLNLGRRHFLRGGAVFAAGAVVTVNTGTAAQAAPADARIRYPSTRLGNVADLQVNEPLEVNYPDADAPGVLLKLGQAIADGVGADGDIVGFSTLTIVDGRSPAALTSERIPGAINLPFPDISPTGTGHLDPNRIYFCYCDGIGSSGSTKVAVRLTSLGFSVRELIGGLDWWKREGYGTEVSDDQSSAGAA